VDVRFLAATNKDLDQARRDKTFREDLYYRIRGAVIELPPLRNRREDIPLLITHLIAKSAEKHGKVIEGIDSDAKAALVAHHWPGNVRELESTLDYMVALAQGPRLKITDVPPQVSGSSSPAEVPPSMAENAASPGTAITLAGMNLAELEKKAIQETLNAVQGNREQAAKILGIGERTLYRKINEYGLKE
jgi:two-component system response regulator HydG